MTGNEKNPAGRGGSSIVRETADLRDEGDKDEQTNAQQPKRAMHGHQHAFGEHRAHCDPYYESQEKFHCGGIVMILHRASSPHVN